MEESNKENYLDRLNKELYKELNRLDMFNASLATKISKLENAIKLLNELQYAIVIAKTDEEFFLTSAKLISSTLAPDITYLYLTSNNDENEFHLLNYNSNYNKQIFNPGIEKLFLNQLNISDKTIFYNLSNQHEHLYSGLKDKFKMDSLIISPVLVDNKTKLLIVLGKNNVDKVLIPDLDISDVEVIKAVGVLISSYLRKTEMIKVTEADKIRTEFVINLAHEFRTPLTLIKGLLCELENEVKTKLHSDSHEKFEVVLQSSKRIEQLIEQLLDISNLEIKGERLIIGKHNLSDIISNSYKAFSSIAKNEDIRFEYSVIGEYSNTWFDADKVTKILTNLLSNAFKYTPKGGDVKLSVETEMSGKENIAIFKVLDTGSGIPPKEKRRIFDRFYRIKESSGKEGTGVGLYVVKQLCELHKGEINLKSSKKGSEFIVSIPVSRNSYTELSRDISGGILPVINEEDEIKKKGEMIIGRKKSSTVLIVEDNKELNKYLANSLSGNFALLKAFNGSEGLQFTLSEMPDLIITDIMMPVMDGIEMLRQIRENEIICHIPVIILTAKTEREHKIEGLEFGADDYISKPFDIDELLLKVRNQLNRIRLLRENYKKSLITEPDESKIIPPEDKFLKILIELFNQNMSDNDFRYSKILSELGVSRTQLYRKTESLTGYSPAELLRILRIKAAAGYFRKGHKNIAQVMYGVGFNNPSNFAKNFKKQYGINPSEYLVGIKEKDADKFYIN